MELLIKARELVELHIEQCAKIGTINCTNCPIDNDICDSITDLEIALESIDEDEIKRNY